MERDDSPLAGGLNLPRFTSCLQSRFLDPVEGGHRSVSPSQLFHLSPKISDQGIELPVIEPVSDMEEEEANKDEAESKNKQLFTCLMLDPDTLAKRDHASDAALQTGSRTTRATC